jgi:hypothetical protein
MGREKHHIVAQEEAQNTLKDAVVFHASKVHGPLFESRTKRLDFLHPRLQLAFMKFRFASAFGWLIGAALLAATLASCAPQAETCSAYQQVQPEAHPAR